MDKIKKDAVLGSGDLLNKLADQAPPDIKSMNEYTI